MFTQPELLLIAEDRVDLAWNPSVPPSLSCSAVQIKVARDLEMRQSKEGKRWWRGINIYTESMRMVAMLRVYCLPSCSLLLMHWFRICCHDVVRR